MIIRPKKHSYTIKHLSVFSLAFILIFMSLSHGFSDIEDGYNYLSEGHLNQARDELLYCIDFYYYMWINNSGCSELKDEYCENLAYSHLLYGRTLHLLGELDDAASNYLTARQYYDRINEDFSREIETINALLSETENRTVSTPITPEEQIEVVNRSYTRISDSHCFELAQQARQLCISHNFHQAIILFEDAIECYPNDIGVHIELAQCYSQIGSLNASNEIIDRIHSTFPDARERVWAFFLCAKNYAALGDYDEALYNLQRALQMDSELIYTITEEPVFQPIINYLSQ